VENETHTYSTLNLSLNGKGVEAYRILPTANRDTFYFYAPSEDIRPSSGSTGVHGKLELYLNNELIQFDNFNFHKLAQRKTFAGEVFKDSAVQTIGSFYNRENLTRDLTTFGFDVWDTHVQSDVTSEMVDGDPFLDVEQYIEGLVIKGGGTIMHAMPKKGKSYTSLAMAVSVDAGIGELWNVQQTNTMYVNFERPPDTLTRRLAGVNTALGLAPSRPLRFMHVRHKRLVDIMDALKWQIETHNIGLIIIDSISQCGMGSLIEDTTALQITKALNSLIEKENRAWIGIAHRGWGSDHVYGSVHFLGACDVMAGIDSAHSDSTGEMGIQITVDAQNDLPPSNPQVIALGFDEMGVKAMRKASLQEFPEFMEAKDEVKDRIKEFLKNKPLQRPRDISKGTGIKGDTIRPILSRLKYDADENPDGIFIEQGGRYGNRTYQFQEKEKPW
jgi:hypothetical protein